MATNKKICYTIEYIAPTEDAGYISECLDKMREYGEADIIDVKILDGKK